MLEEPTYIIFGKDKNLGLDVNPGLDQFIAVDSENLPPPNSGMIVDHTSNFTELKLPNTLNKETTPLLTKRIIRSD